MPLAIGRYCQATALLTASTNTTAKVIPDQLSSSRDAQLITLLELEACADWVFKKQVAEIIVSRRWKALYRSGDGVVTQDRCNRHPAELPVLTM
ncbi:hypothetical protein BJX70DRAFT_357536, partial [Aspergillus crustosus]